MLLSDKAISTLEAVLYIACNARPDPVRSTEIAAQVGRPRRYLEKAMQQLSNAGLLKGVRGPRGGYMLARERRRISVGEILRIATEIENDSKAGANKRKSSTRGMASLQLLCAGMEKDFFRRLDKITIEELCASDAKANWYDHSSKATDVDFNI